MGKINKIINKIFNRGKFVNNILIVSKKGKYGAVNTEGDIVIDFIYDDLHFLTNYQNFLIGEKNGKSSIIDTKTLKPIVENITFEQLPLYYKESPLNITVIKDEKGNLRLFDFTSGKQIYGLTSVSVLENGNLLVNSNGKYGVLSQKLETILPSTYTEISLVGNKYLVRNENTSGFIIQDNLIEFDKISRVNTLTPEKADVIFYGTVIGIPSGTHTYNSNLEDNLFIIKKKDKEYLIKFNENEEIEFLSKGFDEISDVFSADRSVVKNDGKYGYISSNGKITIPCKFDSAETFKNGFETHDYTPSTRYRDHETRYWRTRTGHSLAKVTKNGLCGCVDTNGNIAVPCIFDSVGEFVDGITDATLCGINVRINEQGEGFDIEKIFSLFNNKESLEKIKEQYDKELGE